MITSATFSTSMEAQQAAVLLEGYRFELGHHDARQWVSLWLESYRSSWIRDAVVEALYQGRYKSVSVRQILEMWQRRGQPIRHATHDFEAAVCREFGEVRLAPIAPEDLPKRSPERKRPRSIARPNQSKRHSQSARPVPPQQAEPNPSHRSVRLRPQNNAAVSFNLSALPPASPGMAARGAAVMKQGYSSEAGQTNDQMNDQTNDQTNGQTGSSPKSSDTVEIRDNRDWREFASYTTSTYSASSPDEVLRAQRQFNGVLYSSARAIQPFKPALPFSAQTLRLAKQKAIALMNQAQQDNQNNAQPKRSGSYQPEQPIAELYR